MFNVKTLGMMVVANALGIALYNAVIKKVAGA